MIHVLIGVSGSGKSFKARNLLTQYGGPNKAVIVGRDKIRELVLGHSESSINEYYNSPNFMETEKQITKYEDSIIKYALQGGKTVISDNTHLRVKYLKKYEKFGVRVDYELVEVDYNTALERDSARVRKVGKEVINKQWDSLRRLKEEFDFKSFIPDVFQAPPYDPSKKDAYIWDVDGTLAEHGPNGRSPYEWHRVKEDVVNTNVAKLFRDLRECPPRDGIVFVICSGRDGVCEEDTKDWLADNGIFADEFFIRTPNDNRPDWVVKTEFIKEISSKYNVILCIDNRSQVVDCYRRLGFTVAQIAEGDF